VLILPGASTEADRRRQLNNARVQGKLAEARGGARELGTTLSHLRRPRLRRKAGKRVQDNRSRPTLAVSRRAESSVGIKGRSALTRHVLSIRYAIA